MFNAHLPQQDCAISIVPGLSAARFFGGYLVDNRLGTDLYTGAEGFAGLRASGFVLFMESQQFPCGAMGRFRDLIKIS